MELISKLSFAADCGVSQPAISKAIRQGKIALDGKYVILDDPLTQQYVQAPRKRAGIKKPKPVGSTGKPAPVATKPGRASKVSKPVKVAKKPAPVAPKAGKEPKVSKPVGSTGKPKPLEASREPNPRPDDRVDVSGLSTADLAKLNRSDLDRAKVLEQTLKVRQERETKRGDLIARDLVEAVFGKVYSVENNELRALEDRITPGICGIFGAGDDTEESLKIRELLRDEITQSLRHIQRILNKFLVGKKEDAA